MQHLLLLKKENYFRNEMKKMDTLLIKYPVATEKAIRMIEAENTLTFAVDRAARKPAIKKQVESLYKVKVTKVNTLVTSKGTKRAYVTLAQNTPALDVATQLGLL